MIAAALSGGTAAQSASATTYSNGKAVAADTFDRSAAPNWGSAQIGGTYQESGSGIMSTNGSHGVATVSAPGNSLTETLGSASVQDVDIRTSVTIPKLPTSGSGVYSGLQLRQSGSSFYKAQVRVDPAGSAWISIIRVLSGGQQVVAAESQAFTGLAAGQQFELQFQAVGQNPVALSARAWRDGSPTPKWTSTGSDSSASRLSGSGTIALWAYVSRSSAVVPVSFDNLQAFTQTASGTTPPVTTAPVKTPPVKTPPVATPPVAAPPVTTPPVTTPPVTTPPVATPPATGSSDSTISTAGVRGAVGAATIGTTAYAVPAGALFASVTGSSSGPGTQSAPFASIQSAIDAAPNGGTVVIRGGTYHQSLTIPSGKAVTLQSYPHEAVWLDGSRSITAWTASGSVWSTPWSVAFDDSPTFTRGAADSTVANWAFLNPAFPLAAHPDQVWLDDAALTQVGSLGQVSAGKFFVDTSAKKLYVGSDPSGHAVQASDTVKALTVLGAGSVVRGIGIRRYAPSVPDIGAVTFYGAGSRIENVSITDSATIGLGLEAANLTATSVTIARSGLLGVHANYADNLRVSGMLSTDNNNQHFNHSPVSGGFKVTRSRGISVSHSAFLRNDGDGLWFDESSYNGTIVDNDFLHNTGNGVDIELSSLFTVVNNVIADNTLMGVIVSDSNQVQIWNNTITGGDRAINIAQGDRRASNLSTAGHDPRQSLPDPSVTWITGRVSIENNILSTATGNSIISVQDYSHQQSAAHMGIDTNGNVYQRNSSSQPSWAVIWSTGAGDPAVYTSVSSWVSATGAGNKNLPVDGAQVLTAQWMPLAVVSSDVSSIAQPLPSALAALVSRGTGTLNLGAWPTY